MMFIDDEENSNESDYVSIKQVIATNLETNIKKNDSAISIDDDIIAIDDEVKKSEPINFVSTTCINNFIRKPRFSLRNESTVNKSTFEMNKRVYKNNNNNNDNHETNNNLDYLKIFMNPDSKEVQDMLQNETYVYSDETISTGYKTNVNFKPDVNELHRITYKTTFDNKNKMNDDLNCIDEKIHDILCNNNMNNNSVSDTVYSLAKIYQNDNKTEELILICIFDQISSSESYVEYAEKIINGLVSDFCTSESIIQALKNYRKKHASIDSLKSCDSSIDKYCRLIAYLYKHSVKMNNLKYWLKAVKEHCLQLLDEWSEVYSHVEVDQSVYRLNFKCVANFVNSAIDELRCNNYLTLEKVYEKARVECITNKSERLRKSCMEIIDVFVKSYMKSEMNRPTYGFRQTNNIIISANNKNYGLQRNDELDTNNEDVDALTSQELELMKLFKVKDPNFS